MVARKDLNRKLHYSDNLPVLMGMENESIDLIYLDPPFNSNRAYNIIYPDDLGQITAFDDTWTWTPECDVYLRDMVHLQARCILNALVTALGKVQMCAYLINMAVRLIEMQRILKQTGSIYLHCDPTAGHYLKILMDAIFGSKNCRNDIVWSYQGTGEPRKYFKRKHDYLLFYAKSKNSYFNEFESSEPISDFTKSKYTQVDERGRYKDIRHPDGSIHRQYERNRQRMRAVWELPILNANARERLGYPTQKPIALLDRVIKVSSKEGDLILDPFCGCGTTVAAAEILKRHWIGIDITYSSIAAIKEQFKRLGLDVWGDIEILNKPKTEHDVETNLLSDSARARKEFEKFCVSTIGGLPNNAMGADGGIDGRVLLHGNEVAIVSVKSGHVNIEQVRALKGLLNGKNKIGIFITREKPTQPMVNFANQSGIYEPSNSLIQYAQPIPKIQILTLNQILRGEQPILP